MSSDLAALSAPPLPPRHQRRRPPAGRPAKIEAVIDRLVHGDEFDRLVRNLSPDEQELFWQQVDVLRHSGELSLDDLWKIDYTREPPTIGQFIEDDYWIGAICRKSDESEGLFPAWREVLLRDFDLDSRIHNVVITGSLGVGKTWVATLLILYRVAIAKCMRNPQSFLGLAKGSQILYVMLSVTKASVTETIFGDTKNFMANSPFFMEVCHFNPGKKYASLHIPLGGNIFITAGSRGQHILGRNTMGVVLDEGNWRLEANPDVKAYDLFNEVRMRLSNRFQKINGYLPALSILASSARDESSTTESVINEIRASNSPATERVYRFSVYKIKQHTIKFSHRWFKVEHGVKNMDPRVLAGWYDKGGNPIEAGPHETPTAEAQVELVPENYLAEFKRNIKTALQSVCGVSTGGSHRLFSSVELLEKAVIQGQQAGLTDPCPLGVVSLSDEDTRPLWDLIDHKSFLTRRGGRVVPLRDPDAVRYVHIDLATTSTAGLSICHAVGNTLVKGVYNATTGAIFDQYRRVVAYDFILAITAGQTKPISIRKIQDFIFWLRDYCGFRFGKITADSFESAMFLQIFANRGIESGLQSLDRNKIAYYAWRSAFEEGRILLFRHALLMREAEYLIDHPSGKIDHPDKTPYGPGSKDVTDAAAGAYLNCFSDELKTSATTAASDVTFHPREDVGETAPLITLVPTAPEPRPAKHYAV